MLALPVDDVLPEILAHHAAGRNVVVQALPGAGKTTRVPPAIARTLKQGERLIMLEPRRVAARASAARIASEQGWTLGDEVGFHVVLDEPRGARALRQPHGKVRGDHPQQ